MFIDKYKNNLSAIEIKVREAEEFIAASDPFFNELEGKQITKVICEYSKYLAQFKRYHVELSSLSDLMKNNLETIRSTLYKKSIEGSNRHLTPKENQLFLSQNPEYILASEIVLEMEHISKMLRSRIEALEILNWQFSNLVKLKVASLDEAVF